MSLNYYDVENVIQVSQPLELDPQSDKYQTENVWNIYHRLSRKLTVVNIGPGILYVRVTHDSQYVSEEYVIYEGQFKEYDEIYYVKLRSPSANLRYRVTEYPVSTISGQQFSGSRFKDRRDRDGVIVYQDDYESPTLKFDGLFFLNPPISPPTPISLAPPPATIIRSTDTAYAGDFSIKTIGGPTIFSSVALTYRHPDFHVGRIASQVHFATDASLFNIRLELDFFDNQNVHQSFASISADVTTGGQLCPVLLFIRIPDPTNTSIFKDIEIDTDVTLFRSIHSWNVVKLAVDISASKYVAIFINGERIDLSNFDMFTQPSIIPRHVASFVANLTQPCCRISCGGPSVPIPIPIPSTVFFDNYIFTEDETFV